MVVNDPTPAISLLKEVASNVNGPWRSFLFISPGGQVFYRFTVENIGGATLSSVSLTDNTISTAGCSWVDSLNNPAALTPLPPGEIRVCVLNPGTASGLVTNTATASGTFNATTVQDTSSATYTTTGLALVKVANRSFFNATGDQIVYTYAVTNLGPTTLTGNFPICDNKFSSPFPNCATPATTCAGPLTTLSTVTCQATYTVTAADNTAGVVTNLARATDLGSGAVSNIDSATVRQLPTLGISKTDGLIIREIGQSTTYTITVTNNSGSSNAVAAVTDPAVAGLTKTAVSNGCTATTGGATCPAAASFTIALLQGTGVPVAANSMPAGSSFSFTVTATVTAPTTNVLTFVNVASVAGASDSDIDLYALDWGHLPSSYAGMNLLGANGRGPGGHDLPGRHPHGRHGRHQQPDLHAQVLRRRHLRRRQQLGRRRGQRDPGRRHLPVEPLLPERLVRLDGQLELHRHRRPRLQQLCRRHRRQRLHGHGPQLRLQPDADDPVRRQARRHRDLRPIPALQRTDGHGDADAQRTGPLRGQRAARR